MSFIKITDPRKREEMIKDFIETRKRIKDNFIAHKVGEADYQTGLTKLFKPVTETQKATAKEITDAQKATAEKFTSELLPIREGIEEIPTKLFKKIFPAIDFKDSDIIKLGPLAVTSLIKALTKNNIDLTFGIYAQNGKFKIGDKFIIIENNDIKIKDNGEIIKTFEGTPGLWELVTSKNPKPDNYNDEDLNKYQQLIILTNAAYKNNNPTQNKPKSNRGQKWKEIIKFIWEAIKQQKEDEEYEDEYIEDENGTALIGVDPQPGTSGEYKEFEEPKDDPQPGTSGTKTNGNGIKGKGLKFLPTDPNALIDRFDLLFSSMKAGHTGVKNEIVAILDELKRQKVINVQTYKKLNSLIKK